MSDAPTRLAAIALGDAQLAVLARLHGGNLVGATRTAPLLRAVLHPAAIFPRGFDGPTAFRNVMTERLFDVHILARLAGPDSQERMPMVGSGNGNDIQVLVFQRLSNVLKTLRRVAALLTNFLAPRLEETPVGID